MDAGAIVPVPLHRVRRRERGLSGKTFVTEEQRWIAVRGAFALGKGHRVDNLRILLLDDVMTAGAARDACSRALRDGGAKSVVGLTIARAGQATGSFGTPGSWKRDGR